MDKLKKIFEKIEFSIFKFFLKRQINYMDQFYLWKLRDKYGSVYVEVSREKVEGASDSAYEDLSDPWSSVKKAQEMVNGSFPERETSLDPLVKLLLDVSVQIKEPDVLKKIKEKSEILEDLKECGSTSFFVNGILVDAILKSNGEIEVRENKDAFKSN